MSTLEELQEKWTQRMLEAKEADEPLYVTVEEYQELQRMESMRQRSLTPAQAALEDLQRKIIPTIGLFIGTPVVVTR